MNKFLDLTLKIAELVQGLALRDINEGRKAVLARMEELGPDAEGDEFDQLAVRCQEIDDHLAATGRVVERSERLTALRTGSTSGGATTITRSAPLPISRGIEPVRGNRERHPTYSLQRAVGCLLRSGQVSGYEAEVSQEIAKRSGKTPQGFYMPMSREDVDDEPIERAVVNTTVGSSVIATRVEQTLIEKLQNRLAMAQFNCTILSGLKDGAIQLPKRTGNNTAYHVAESADITDSNITLGSVTLTPKTIGASTYHSRKFLLQQSVVNESLLQDYLEQAIRLEMDRVGVNGSGSGAIPTGILQNSTIAAAKTVIGTNGGPLTFAAAVAMETAVAASNADIGNLGYLTNSKVRGSAKTILEASASGSKMIWSNNEINGYKAVASNQVPSNLTKGSSSGVCSALIFGNFQDAVYGFWSGVDVLVNPYKYSLSGAVELTAMLDYDFGILREESFNIILDLTT